MSFYETSPLPVALEDKPEASASFPSFDNLGSTASILALVVALVAYRRAVHNTSKLEEFEAAAGVEGEGAVGSTFGRAVGSAL